jgi:hypothetical protein
LALDVIGEEVARDADVLIVEVEVTPEERDEVASHLWIRIRESDLIAGSGSLSPVEHAAGDV